MKKCFPALFLVVCFAIGPARAATVSIDASSSGRQQTIDGFGTCIGNDLSRDAWFRTLYYDDLGCAIMRMDLTPQFVSPYSDLAYYSPHFMGSGTKSVFNFEDPANPAGPEGNYVRRYTNSSDYSRTFGGKNAPIAVMGPDINANIAKMNITAADACGLFAQVGQSKQGANFKLYGSIWSPAPWLKIASGNVYNESWWPGPAAGTPYPFIWMGNYAGGKLDVSNTPLSVFNDGTGPTSALTQFARCTAAYIKGIQDRYGVRYYALSIQNEVNFEEFYGSCTYPLSSQYIAALKAVRAEFDKYADLRSIQIAGPEDLMGGDPYGMWQYGGGSTVTHKNLQYLQNIDADPAAKSALSFFCIHGYASDGASAAGANPTQWNWWTNGWTTSPAAGIPTNVKGFAAYGKKSWMTETSGEQGAWLYPASGFPNNGGFSIALKIQQALTAGRESAWIYWQFAENDSITASTLTSKLTQAAEPKYVGAKHFFKYIRPGSVRVNATCSDSLTLASAFVHDANQTLTIELVNTGTADQSVSTALPAGWTSITSFTTLVSRSGSLAVAGTANVSGGSVTITVPAYGVATLQGNITATNQAPTVATAASASPNPAAGTTTALSVLGADDGGEAALSYTWATTGTPPAAVSFSANGNNAAKNTTATFTKAGSYSFQATIRDAAGLTVTSSTTVLVNQTLTLIAVSPASASINTGATQQFSATAKDQFGTALSAPPAITWTVTGGGIINGSGLFSAGSTAGGPFTVTAASGGKNGTASVTVTSTGGGGKIATSARVFPRSGLAGRINGGKFQSSNDMINWTTLYTITATPADGAWTTYSWSNTTHYRYLRFLSPDGGYGNISELQFFAGSTQLIGAGFGTAGSWSNAGNTFDKALDNNTATYFDAPDPGNGAYVGIDLGSTGYGNGTGLAAQYYDNADFTNIKVTRTDATVNFDWGGGSPDASVGVDTFSARWTGQVQPRFSETYTFYTQSDDGIRLWVNGQQVINNWTDHAPTENSGTVALSAGQKYDIKLEFFENGGGAVAKLLWSSASETKAVIPQSQLYPVTLPVIGNGTGLTGQYFDNADFTNLKITRTDATVNFDWGSSTPNTALSADTFSTRWTGQVQAKFSETVTFYTVSDDGIRLWVNGQQIINNWTDHGPTENSGTISLTAGQKYDLKLEFYENGGGAVAKLLWSSASLTKEVIPASNLYPAAVSAILAETAFGPLDAPVADDSADDDGDGLLNGYELSMGFDPANADSDGNGTPDGNETISGGGLTQLEAQQVWLAQKNGARGEIRSVKLKAAVNFSASGKDTLSVSGTLPSASAGAAAGSSVILNVGGVMTVFKPDAKGSVRTSQAKFSLIKKGPRPLAFSAQLKGTFLNALAANGIVVNADEKNAARTLRVELTFGGTIYSAEVSVHVSAKKDRGARLKN